MRVTDTNSFIKMGRSVHGDDYDYSLSKYVSAKDQILIICKVHGIFSMKANNHKISGCSECGRRKKRFVTLDSFKQRAISKHGYKYDYSGVLFKKITDIVSIGCDIHGVFKQSASVHLSGSGCRKCAMNKISESMKISHDEYIRMANIKHNGLYLYDDTVYCGAKSMVKIRCRIHGEFTQVASEHLAGSGCFDCSKMKNFKRSSYIERANLKYNGVCKFYVLRIVDMNGVAFFKIGITLRRLKDRYPKSIMPYAYTIERQIEGDAGKMFDFERFLKTSLISHKYSPSIVFHGAKTECFDCDISTIDKHIGDFLEGI